MLKRSLVTAAAILVAACAESPTQPTADVSATAAGQKNRGDLLTTAADWSGGANTTVVCHSSGLGGMNLLNIDGNALAAHLGHGDFQAGPARLLADGYVLFNGTRVRGPFPHEYWIEVTCNGFVGTGQFPTGDPNPSVTEVITGTYDGSTLSFRSDYDNVVYWYEYGPGPASGTGPGTDANGLDLEIDVTLQFN